MGCNRGIQNEDAVKQGVVDHLSSRTDLNMSQMQVVVTAVSFRENEADATVSFRPKGGGASSGIEMKYTLERKDNRWVVKGKASSPHGQMPPPGMQNPVPGQSMPPGHPPMNPGAPAGKTK